MWQLTAVTAVTVFCVTASTASNRFVSRQNSTQNWKEIPEGNTAKTARLKISHKHCSISSCTGIIKKLTTLPKNFLEVEVLYSIISVTYDTDITISIDHFVLVEAYTHGQEWSSCLLALSKFLDASKTCISTFDRTSFDVLIPTTESSRLRASRMKVPKHIVKFAEASMEQAALITFAKKLNLAGTKFLDASRDTGT